ncbi:unnamed protein product, partial [Durusdinium trenchii]
MMDGCCVQPECLITRTGVCKEHASSLQRARKERARSTQGGEEAKGQEGKEKKSDWAREMGRVKNGFKWLVGRAGGEGEKNLGVLELGTMYEAKGLERGTAPQVATVLNGSDFAMNRVIALVVLVGSVVLVVAIVYTLPSQDTDAGSLASKFTNSTVPEVELGKPVHFAFGEGECLTHDMYGQVLTMPCGSKHVNQTWFLRDNLIHSINEGQCLGLGLRPSVVPCHRAPVVRMTQRNDGLFVDAKGTSALKVPRAVGGPGPVATTLEYGASATPFSMVPAAGMRMVTYATDCLAVLEDDVSVGTGDCNAASSKALWTVDGDKIIATAAGLAGLCLSLQDPPQVLPCDGRREQQLTVTQLGRVATLDAAACLEIAESWVPLGANNTWAPASLQLDNCQDAGSGFQ